MSANGIGLCASIWSPPAMIAHRGGRATDCVGQIRNPKSRVQPLSWGAGRAQIRVLKSESDHLLKEGGGGGGSLEIVEIVSGARYLMSSKSQVRNPTWPLVIVKHLRNPEFPNPKSKMSAEGRKVPLNPESPNPKSDTPPER